MNKKQMPYQRQIFVCTNDAKGEKASCGDHKGEEIFRALRETAKQKGLHPKIRVAQAKCLGQCNQGVNIMIYPENIWFNHVRLEDAPAIADEYIQ